MEDEDELLYSSDEDDNIITKSREADDVDNKTGITKLWSKILVILLKTEISDYFNIAIF